MKKSFKLVLVLAVIFSLSYTSGALLGKVLHFVQPLVDRGIRLKQIKSIIENLLILDFHPRNLAMIYHLCWPRGP